MEHKEQRTMQQEYSSAIFSDSELKDIAETRDEEGELQWISIRFSVFSEMMAELLINFLVKLAINSDALVEKKDTYGGNSWRGSQDLLDIANEIFD